MEAASMHFGNNAYNMSGVTTEQSVTSKTTINGIRSNSSFDDIEFINEQYDSDEMQDVEIIAIDPNSFYSSDVSPESSESSESGDNDNEDDDDDDDDDEDEEIVVSEGTSFNPNPFEMQPTNEFDIITLNIDDEFIDPQTDDILFKNDHQFDLASYIGGESTSLLLSPVNDAASARRRLISLSDFTHVETNEFSSIRNPVSATHDNVSKTPANNHRRKRKNLSREFIESSDSDSDENETKVAPNSINYDLDENSKRNKVKLRKNDDPVWNPAAEKKRSTKPTPKSLGNRAKEFIKPKALNEEKKSGRTGLSVQGNSLRNMIKQQLLSDRPTSKTKFKTMIGDKTNFTEKVGSTKVVPCPVQRTGVGRGKDIQITAKYYNCNDASDSSDRDNSSKKDRYHQIYTDSDESDIDVSSKPEMPATVVATKKSNPIIEKISNAEVEVASNQKKRVHSPQKQSSHIKIEKKFVNTEKKSSLKIKANGNSKPVQIDNNSMDSTDFAKALVTTHTKTVPKKLSASTAMKKNNLEQQKRLIQSTLLLQNPAKFKIFATDKCKETSNGERSFSENNVNQSLQGRTNAENVNLNAKLKTEPIESVQKLPKSAEKELDSCVQKIKSENSNDENVKQETLEDVKPDDIMLVEETKVESSAKRKLNLQEYLKRKSLKTSTNSSAGNSNGKLLINIKTERTENSAMVDSKKNKTTGRDDDGPVLSNNSMYEEIIIVSMGCNTDISIPNFIQPPETKASKSTEPTVLLSDIQTTVEKANSKISSCSLISSIQDVILKKSHSVEQRKEETNNANANKGDARKSEGKEKGDDVPEHGENKVIMHLRKDRVRPLRSTTSIQTDPYFQFPPLEKLAPLPKKQSAASEKRNCSIPRDNRSNEARYLRADSQTKSHRSFRGTSHLSASSYYSDEEEKSMQRRSRHSDFIERKTQHGRRTRRESSRFSSSKYDRYLSRTRTISRSLSTSSDNSATSTDSSSTTQSSSSSSTYVSSASARSLNSYGGSSSKSHYGDDHQYYRKRTTSNNSRRSNYRKTNSKRSNSPEERRIVYVGRIEDATTKEEIRRKFSMYGQVKHISLHYKENKMKYGFVTFARPCDAYTAIDSSKRNPAISHYDVSFGGRRAFCREKYFDLDNSCSATTYCEEPAEVKKPPSENGDSFDVLLRKMKEKLHETRK